MTLVILTHMSKKLLNKAYSPEEFRKTGLQLVELLATYLENVQNNDQEPVMKWKNPNEQFHYWKDYMESNSGSIDFFKELIDRSIHIHHPKYMGHQVSAPAPLTALTAMVTALLNNGMAIYEMGPSASALEKWVVEQFIGRMGFGKSADGFLTSGGTLATLTALLAARQMKADGDVWDDGNKDELTILVPAESHYCVDRAARIMGFGEDGIIKVSLDENFRMRTDLLSEKLQLAQDNGKKVIAVVANACSTSTGTYDDLDSIGDFCSKHKLWFHVDAAHGGGAIFSEKYKHRLNGIKRADSVIIDLHKMLMNPALATLVMFKNGPDSYQTFNQKAQYLWEKNEDPEWFNYAKRTFECTKLMMSVKFCSLINEYGFEIFDENVTTLYDLASSFAKLIKERPGFELVTDPMANIVCFRLLSKKPSISNNTLNSKIRRNILENGDFYIVQTELNDNVYLRVTLMNPFSQITHMVELLDTVIAIGSNLENEKK